MAWCCGVRFGCCGLLLGAVLYQIASDVHMRAGGGCRHHLGASFLFPRCGLSCPGSRNGGLVYCTTPSCGVGVMRSPPVGFCQLQPGLAVHRVEGRHLEAAGTCMQASRFFVGRAEHACSGMRGLPQQQARQWLASALPGCSHLGCSEPSILQHPSACHDWRVLDCTRG